MTENEYDARYTEALGLLRQARGLLGEIQRDARSDEEAQGLERPLAHLAKAQRQTAVNTHWWRRRAA